MNEFVDWHDIANAIQGMSIEERLEVFKRTDCPVWLLNQNAGVISHLSLLIQTGVVEHE